MFGRLPSYCQQPRILGHFFSYAVQMKTNCGTTIFSIITKHGITIGADSFARHHDGHIEAFSKLRVIRGAVIACEGLGMIKPETTGDVPHYRADQWMAEIESSLPVELNAEIIARAIETTHPFLQLVRVEEMIRLFYDSQFHSGKGYLADFLIASATSDRMLLLRVRAKMVLISQLDDPQWRVVFDKTAHLDRHSPIDPFVRHHAGKHAEIDKAMAAWFPVLREGRADQQRSGRARRSGLKPLATLRTLNPLKIHTHAGVARRIVWAWIITIPASAAAAGLTFCIIRLVYAAA
jgi:hypothetical protein